MDSPKTFDPIAHARAVRENPEEFANMGVMAAIVFMRRSRTEPELKAIFSKAWPQTKGHELDRACLKEEYERKRDTLKSGETA